MNEQSKAHLNWASEILGAIYKNLLPVPQWAKQT